AGEALLPADVKRWVEVFGERIRLVNLYGPTETTVTKLCYFVEAADAERASIPIGKPIRGAAAMVMNSAGRHCASGTAGEIYIRTPYRSLGYYGAPELTNEVFVLNPFSSDPNDLLYRTGDYGRQMKDGNLEFLGRRDQQVKVRGVRVELGEIENLLRRHADVKDVAVIDREDAGGNKYLCAYVVLSNGTGTGTLREYLAAQLPEFMVPSGFVEMRELPRTLNGKIDRKALPALEEARSEKKTEVRPRTPVEEIVAGIWSEVLRLPQIGVEENFFELGGHSLLATQIISRIRESLHVELPLRALFEAPRVADLARRIEQETKAAQAQSETVPLQPVSREGDLPLSYSQQRMWMLEQISPGSSAYHIPLAISLRGELNIPALEQNFGEVIRRHEVLRTSFAVQNGEPVQLISAPAAYTLPVVDLSGLCPEEQEGAIRRIAAENATRSFDLANGRLFRAVLLRQSATEHAGLCTMHHIVSDGWSRGVLISELSSLYQQFSRGEPSLLPELAIQYGDFAVWQKKWMDARALEAEMGYWKKQLNGVPAVLALPLDRPRPAAQTFNGAREVIIVPENVSEALVALGRKSGMTPFMILLAAFKILMYRYTGQADLVVGTSIAGRNRTEIEGLIGFFVNMLALRTNISGDPTLVQYLQQMRETTLEAFLRQDLPFELLVEALQPQRDLSYTPIFQVVFSLQNVPVSEMSLSGLTLGFPEIEETAAKYDLLLDMREVGSGFAGVLEYNTDLFDTATAHRIATHYQQLLKSIASAPAQRISEMPLLTEAERHEMLVDWNQSRSEYPAQHCIHELFEAVVRNAPQEIAVSSGNEVLNYDQLNRRANQLAHYLLKIGSRPGSLVGICMKHSPVEIVALLAVLKAGAAYIALDPDHPVQRSAAILSRCGAHVVLTEPVLANSLRSTGAVTISLEREWPRISSESEENPVSSAAPQDLAYVIYTSGSTGEPKGVAITHKCLVNYIWWAKSIYLRDEKLAFPLYSSLAFDLTVTSIYTALISGNKLIIYGQHQDELPLTRIFLENEAGVLKLTPSHLLLVRDWDNRRSSIKKLIVGGEAFTTRLALEVYDSFGGNVEIYNEYGPTEATVGCMIYKFDPACDRAFVPIGRAAANAQIYVLDAALNPVPQNVTGELYIAGDGLARGYLGQPELTAERFLDNPFTAGQKMYKTGDLAKWLPGGILEFLGRADGQVKLSGFRIELGEIEVVLGKHPEVRDVLAAVWNERLVAYVVPASENGVEISELRQFMQERVPHFMVPGIFIKLDALPLSANGKVDRKNLPVPDGQRAESVDMYAPPETSMEKSIAAMWQEVLGVKEPGIHDDFFHLGGQSIMAIRIVQRINQAFQINLPMRAIFTEPTIASLALLVEETLIEKLEAATATTVAAGNN
ncbi:MAG: non-ribosomal peptide synthetase, partial [Candidatus Angelobacter sp. Gp1-AA117]